MKTGWERANAIVTLDAAALNELIQPVFPAGTVTAAELLTGGLANTLYRISVRNHDRPLVVRLYTRAASACRQDSAIYNLVHAAVPMPTLLYSDPFGSVGGVPYAISEWIEGVRLQDLLLAGDQADAGAAMFAVGEVLARIGTFQFPQPGFFDADLNIVQPLAWDGAALRSFIEHCLFEQNGQQWLTPESARRLWSHVSEHAGLLDALAPIDRLVHADFNAPNMLVQQTTEGWRVAAVLDWEFALAGPPLLDVANMLRHEHRLPPVVAEQFVAGFKAGGGKLPEHWHQMAKLLDLLNLCQFLTEARGEQMVRDVRELIQTTVEQWSTFGSHA